MTKEHKYMFIAGWQNVSFQPRRNIKILTTNKNYFLAGMLINGASWLLAIALTIFIMTYVDSSLAIILYALYITGQFRVYGVNIPKEYTWEGFQ